MSEQQPVKIPEDGNPPGDQTSTRARQQQSPRQREWLNRLSLTQMTTKNWSFAQDVSSIKSLGLNHIGLWRWKCDDLTEEELIAQLQKSQITPSSLSWLGGFTGVNGYLVDDAVEEAAEQIQLAHHRGIKTLVACTGEQGPHIQTHATRLAADALRELGDAALPLDLQIAVMPMSSVTSHGWTFLTSIRKCREFLDQCNHPQVGACLNTFHLMQERNWKTELKSLIPDLKLVRLCDAGSPRRATVQQLPFSGQLKLTALVEYLESQGYRGMYEIDTWSDEVWQLMGLAPFRRSIQSFVEIIG
ncbi:MAG: sugar phosphate isomerase/epimerase [Planctomycetaceae bacterium]|nr:sugar phosphate isomerase/epimerase [Planctomycetaceae bacterium]